ncbi:hypothetical protein Tco_0375397 [Tanacetum coccineum]
MMGQMSFFLGLQISQSPRGIFINQSKYAFEIVKKYGLHSTDSIDTPMIENKKRYEDLQGKPVDATLYYGMIGSLMYLTGSRADLNYVVCLCARYQAKPTEKHLQAIKRIFRYLNGTINMGLWYSKDTDMSLTAYADADHAGCQDTRRNTSGSAQFLGDKLVSWSSKKQKSTAISSTEAEYIAFSGSKHIDIRYHFIKEQVDNGIVELYFFRTEYQLADIFTKPLPRERFNFLIDKLGMRRNVETSGRGNGRVMVNVVVIPVCMCISSLHCVPMCQLVALIMTSITAEQTKLDLELVPKENRLDIRKCNGRIPRGLKPKEETFQVVLVDLTLSRMLSYIFQIFPRVPGRDFDDLPSEEDTISFLRDLGHTRVINSLNDVVIDQMHQPWRTFAALINRSLSERLVGSTMWTKDVLLRVICRLCVNDEDDSNNEQESSDESSKQENESEKQ